MSKKIVLVVPKSANSKTGKVSVTYAPIQSCPTSCPFLDNGCYAQFGHCGIHLSRLNKNAKINKMTRPIDIARIEAQAIRQLKSDLPLRLHIVGDCSTPRAAQILADACEEYIKRTGQKVWTYTHAWKTIPRKKWGAISVLASCETIEDAKYAMKRGYAASMVRAKPFENTFSYKGIKMVPCPETVNGTLCDKCRLCFNDTKLHNGQKVICFFPHGSGKEQARKALFTNSYVPKKKHPSPPVPKLAPVPKVSKLSSGLKHRNEFKKKNKDDVLYNI